MATKTLRSLKGRVARITRLDECGTPVYALCSVVTTRGFITVTWSHEYQEGEEHQQQNAWGEFCIDEKDADTLRWAPVSINFCEVNPDVLDIVGGANPVTFGSDTIGATFGTSAPTGAFALELWTKKAGGACGAAAEWGYAVFPFIKNGKLDGDVTVENGPLNFTLAGEANPATADWGIGPHNDNPLKAVSGFPVGDVWGIVTTDVQPPDPTTSCAELEEPPDQGAVEPGDLFVADPAVTAEDNAEAATLVGLGYIAADVPAWAIGEYFTIGTYRFHWGGSAWAAGPMPDILNIVPGDFFQPDPTVTAETAAEALDVDAGLYTPDSPGAWSTGEYFSIGTFRFNWDGANWDEGPA